MQETGRSSTSADHRRAATPSQLHGRTEDVTQQRTPKLGPLPDLYMTGLGAGDADVPTERQPRTRPQATGRPQVTWLPLLIARNILGLGPGRWWAPCPSPSSDGAHSTSYCRTGGSCHLLPIFPASLASWNTVGTLGPRRHRTRALGPLPGPLPHTHSARAQTHTHRAHTHSTHPAGCFRGKHCIHSAIPSKGLRL